MSRVGNAPISIPDGVSLSMDLDVITVKGSKGELQTKVPSSVDVSIGDNVVKFSAKGTDNQTRSYWGTIRANVANMVHGVSSGFTKNLEINGVGYRAALQGNKLQLSLGFSHPVEIEIPAGLQVSVDGTTKIAVAGADKELIGKFAAEIRSKRPPEPFKGKGIKYANEYIVRKEGKKK
ncbi:50S ribosomal protein L6 [Alphaproteobacteria bacterium]|jgi:large subunit ribosomal protein L6|nr:50S ribosomal protein L6 [Alphaproteobacteria bacterium]